MGLFGLFQAGFSLSGTPLSFQLMLIPTLLAPLLGGPGLFVEQPSRLTRVACGAFLAGMALMAALPLAQLSRLLALGGYVSFVNALVSILATLFWLHQLARIVFEEEPELKLSQVRISLGAALACSFLASLWLTRNSEFGWSFQLQAAGSLFYGFTGWKVWNGCMALLSLGLVMLGGRLVRTSLVVWSLGWLVGGLLLVLSPLELGMSRFLMLAIPLFPAALGAWLWAELD